MAERGEEPRVEPPKRGQIRAAMSTGGFPRLESKYLEILKETDQPRKDPLALIKDCFKVENVMPKAVLLKTPGVRLSAYTTESELLDLIKDDL